MGASRFLVLASLLCTAGLSGAEVRAAPVTILGDTLSGWDKPAHATASIVVTDATFLGLSAWRRPLPDKLLVASAVGLSAGLAKEVLDLLGFGTPSLVDLGYDVLGVAAGVGFALALEATLVRADRATAEEVALDSLDIPPARAP